MWLLGVPVAVLPGPKKIKRTNPEK